MNLLWPEALSTTRKTSVNHSAKMDCN